MKSKLSDAEIVALIEQEETQAYGIHDAELSAQRAEAIRYYNGEPFGNEIEGRSQVVSRDVLDVIESALPQILKVFVSGDEVVEFKPKNQDDIEAAAQEGDYINHVVMQKNPGFSLFYTWMKDALVSKNGYVKAWYEEKERTESEFYRGLTDDQLTMLTRDERVSVIEHTAYPDEYAGQQRMQTIQQLQQAAQQNPQAQQQLQQIMQAPEPMLHDVRVEVGEKYGCIVLANIAPEDILVSTDCREVSVQKARFVQHRSLMDKAELDEQGWDVPDHLPFSHDADSWEEQNSRDLYGEDDNQEDDEVLVKDTYIRIDGKIKRYVIAGNHILHKEEAEIIPIATLTPHVMPHRHIGMSYADLCTDIQLIKTSLIRGQLDNIALSNNGRYAVSDRVNLSDMLTSRPGGVVRVSGDPAGAIMPLSHTPFPPTSFTMVEYLDSIKEKRTGITAYNQGLDADSLNKTATGISQIMNAAMQRLELVARTFAETGVKELFMLVHRLVRQNYTRPDIVKLRDKWVEVDPRVWKNRDDMVVAVGLGTGNKDQQLQHLSNLYQMQMAALQAGLPIVNPENIYNTVRQIAINAGFKQAELFVSDPKNAPPPPQPQEPPEVMIEKMKLQARQQEMQMEMQVEQQKAQQSAQIEQQKADAQLRQEHMRSTNDVTIEREKIAAQIELEKWRAQLEAQTKLQIAAMDRQMRAEERATGLMAQ